MRMLRPAVSDWPLPTRRRRFAFLAVAVIAAAALAFEAARVATAVTLGASADPVELKRALAMDPDNAEIEHRLGMTLFYTDSPRDRGDGLEHLRRATALNPREALYWADLAAACEASQEASCAGGAMTRALDASPMTPRLYWSAANLDLRAARQGDALGRFERLLRLDPAYAGAVFRVCLQMLGTGNVVEQGILAANRNPHVSMAFVNLASSLGDGDAAFAEWRHLYDRYAQGGDDAATGAASTLSLAEVEPYLDYLIDIRREQDAIAVWADLERLGVVAARDSSHSGSNAGSGFSAPADQLVFNGGFERAPLNAGFDWRYNPQPFVSATISDAPHSGARSLRVEFTGDRNREYEPIFEIVPVEPGSSNTLSAFVRSDSITSDTGPSLRVRDLACSSGSCLDFSTAGVTSTTPWHAVSVSFIAGPETSFVRLSIWRPPSRGYPAEITGVLWVDDVSIIQQPLEASVAGTTRLRY
jgi:tetratricopeptide (TPR) repeat protein